MKLIYNFRYNTNVIINDKEQASAIHFVNFLGWICISQKVIQH